MGGRKVSSSTNIGFIKKFKTAGEQQRKKYLTQAAPSEIHSLCECVLNVCNGNIPINKRALVRLKPYKETLRKISAGKGTRKLLIQKGGFLPLIASAVLPALLGSIVSKLTE
jgi:hypothetical protein